MLRDMADSDQGLVIRDCTVVAEMDLEPLAPSDPSNPDKPAHFDYITENIYISQTLQASRDRKRAKRMVCDCQFDPELDELHEACGENCLNRLLMIECGSRCPCGEYCNNKNFQRAIYSKVEVFRTEKKGWGLRGSQRISSGSFVMEYCGEVCTISDFEQRKLEYGQEKRRHYYFMSLRNDEILDATRKGNLSRYINHSCDPNCETQKWTVNGRLRIGFFSLREIEMQEELTFDYQFQRFGDVAQKCYCGAASCRGYLGQTKLAPPFNRVSGHVSDHTSPQSPSSSRKRGKHRTQNEADSAFEKEIYDIIGSSWRLKECDQVVAISRTMLQAETPSQRTMLLQVVLATEDLGCLRKFLSLQGLRLLWSWMVDTAEPCTSEALQFRVQVLETLAHLPVANKNQLDDSKLLPVVARWAENTNRAGKSSTATPTDNMVAMDTPVEGEAIAEMLAKNMADTEMPIVSDGDMAIEGVVSVDMPMDDGTSIDMPSTEGKASVDTPTEGVANVDMPTEGKANVDTPTEGVANVHTPVEGVVSMDTPTEGAASLNMPTKGASSVDTPTEGVASVETPTAGVDTPTEDMTTMDMPTEGVTSVDMPTEGVASVDTPTEGVANVDMPIDGVTSVDMPAEGVAGVDTPTEGVANVGVPTEGVASVDTPTEGVASVDMPIEGVTSVDTPTEGVANVDMSIDGVTSVDMPAEGVAGVDTPTEGVAMVDMPTEGVASVDMPTEGVASADMPIEGVTSVDTPTEGVANVDTPTEGVDMVDMPTEGVANVDVPTEGVASVDVPTEGLTSVDMPTEGVTSVDTPTEGVDMVDMPTEGVANVDVPTEGVANVDVPTEGVTSVDMPTEGVTSVDVPTEGVASVDLPTDNVDVPVDNVACVSASEDVPMEEIASSDTRTEVLPGENSYAVDGVDNEEPREDGMAPVGRLVDDSAAPYPSSKELNMAADAAGAADTPTEGLTGVATPTNATAASHIVSEHLPDVDVLTEDNANKVVPTEGTTDGATPTEGVADADTPTEAVADMMSETMTNIPAEYVATPTEGVVSIDTPTAGVTDRMTETMTDTNIPAESVACVATPTVGVASSDTPTAGVADMMTDTNIPAESIACDATPTEGVASIDKPTAGVADMMTETMTDTNLPAESVATLTEGVAAIDTPTAGVADMMTETMTDTNLPAESVACVATLTEGVAAIDTPTEGVAGTDTPAEAVPGADMHTEGRTCIETSAEGVAAADNSMNEFMDPEVEDVFATPVGSACSSEDPGSLWEGVSIDEVRPGIAEVDAMEMVSSIPSVGRLEDEDDQGQDEEGKEIDMEIDQLEHEERSLDADAIMQTDEAHETAISDLVHLDEGVAPSLGPSVDSTGLEEGVAMPFNDTHPCVPDEVLAKEGVAEESSVSEPCYEANTTELTALEKDAEGFGVMVASQACEDVRSPGRFGLGMADAVRIAAGELSTAVDSSDDDTNRGIPGQSEEGGGTALAENLDGGVATETRSPVARGDVVGVAPDFNSHGSSPSSSSELCSSSFLVHGDLTLMTRVAMLKSDAGVCDEQRSDEGDFEACASSSSQSMNSPGWRSLSNALGPSPFSQNRPLSTGNTFQDRRMPDMDGCSSPVSQPSPRDLSAQFNNSPSTCTGESSASLPLLDSTQSKENDIVHLECGSVSQHTALEEEFQRNICSPGESDVEGNEEAGDVVKNHDEEEGGMEVIACGVPPTELIDSEGETSQETVDTSEQSIRDVESRIQREESARYSCEVTMDGEKMEAEESSSEDEEVGTGENKESGVDSADCLSTGEKDRQEMSAELGTVITTRKNNELVEDGGLLKDNVNTSVDDTERAEEMGGWVAEHAERDLETESVKSHEMESVARHEAGKGASTGSPAELVDVRATLESGPGLKEGAGEEEGGEQLPPENAAGAKSKVTEDESEIEKKVEVEEELLGPDTCKPLIAGNEQMDTCSDQEERVAEETNDPLATQEGVTLETEKSGAHEKGDSAGERGISESLGGDEMECEESGETCLNIEGEGQERGAVEDLVSSRAGERSDGVQGSVEVKKSIDEKVDSDLGSGRDVSVGEKVLHPEEHAEMEDDLLCRKRDCTALTSPLLNMAEGLEKESELDAERTWAAEERMDTGSEGLSVDAVKKESEPSLIKEEEGGLESENDETKEPVEPVVSKEVGDKEEELPEEEMTELVDSIGNKNSGDREKLLEEMAESVDAESGDTKKLVELVDEQTVKENVSIKDGIEPELEVLANEGMEPGLKLEKDGTETGVEDPARDGMEPRLEGSARDGMEPGLEDSSKHGVKPGLEDSPKDRIEPGLEDSAKDRMEPGPEDSPKERMEPALEDLTKVEVRSDPSEESADSEEGAEPGDKGDVAVVMSEECKVLQLQVEETARKLLAKWEGLKEVFRIPKKATQQKAKRPSPAPEPAATSESSSRGGSRERHREGSNTLEEHRDRGEEVVFRRRGRSRWDVGEESSGHHHSHHHQHHSYHHQSQQQQHHRYRDRSPTRKSSSNHSLSGSHTPSGNHNLSSLHASPSIHSSGPHSSLLSNTPQATPTSAFYSGLSGSGGGSVHSPGILQQPGQNLYAQQQISRNGRHQTTTVLPTQFIPTQNTLHQAARASAHIHSSQLPAGQHHLQAGGGGAAVRSLLMQPRPEQQQQQQQIHGRGPQVMVQPTGHSQSLGRLTQTSLHSPRPIPSHQQSPSRTQLSLQAPGHVQVQMQPGGGQFHAGQHQSPGQPLQGQALPIGHAHNQGHSQVQPLLQPQNVGHLQQQQQQQASGLMRTGQYSTGHAQNQGQIQPLIQSSGQYQNQNAGRHLQPHQPQPQPMIPRQTLPPGQAQGQTPLLGQSQSVLQMQGHHLQQAQVRGCLSQPQIMTPRPTGPPAQAQLSSAQRVLLQPSVHGTSLQAPQLPQQQQQQPALRGPLQQSPQMGTHIGGMQQPRHPQHVQMQHPSNPHLHSSLSPRTPSGGAAARPSQQRPALPLLPTPQASSSQSSMYGITPLVTTAPTPLLPNLPTNTTLAVTSSLPQLSMSGMARTGGSLGLQNVGVAGSSAQPQQPLLMGMSQRVQGSHSTTVPVNASQQAGLILQSSTSLPGQAVAATPTAQTALPPPESQATPTLPHNWKMAKDPKGKPYYYHVITRKTQWDVPVSTDEGTIIMDLGTPEPEQSTEDGENSRAIVGPRTPVEAEETPHTPLVFERGPRTPPVSGGGRMRPSSSRSRERKRVRSRSPNPRTPVETPPTSPKRHRSFSPEDDTFRNTPVSSPSGPFHISRSTFGMNTPPPDSALSGSPSPHPRTPSFSPPTSSTTPSSRKHHISRSFSVDDQSLDLDTPTSKRRRKSTKKEEQQKEIFRHMLSKVVTSCLDSHRKSECKYGRITCAEDFKYLARKLTYGLTEKEASRKKKEKLEFTDSVRAKVKEYIRQYMKKTGPVYRRHGGSP